MIRKKWIDITAAAGIILSLLFSLVLSYAPDVFALEPNEVTMEYETEIFDKEAIMTVDIIMSDDKWQEMLDNAMAEEYYSCDVVVNGVTYKNVAIRPKGNTSLSQVANDDTTDRYSFKIEFDRFHKNQTLSGLDKLVLNNMIADATYRKEYISYDIMSWLGVDTSLYSYASVSVNGENWGLYFALEAMEESYAQRCFGSSYGQLYKPESMDMGGDGGGMSGGSGADLAYTDDDLDSYRTVFESAVFGASESDYRRVVKALKNLDSGTNIEDYIDVEGMINYIASNTFLINDDSYFGTLVHNYYLYEKDGTLNMLPWDYNLAFGGFQSNDAGGAVNRGIDDVVSSGTSLEKRPMIGKLLEFEEYKEAYYACLDRLISGYFESGLFESRMAMLDELIDEYVKEDPTAFYTYEEYTEARDMLLKFCTLRAQSIRGQLEGTIPASADERTEQTVLVDASEIDLSVMGTQFGGKGGPGEGKGGMEMPENSNRMPDTGTQENENPEVMSIAVPEHNTNEEESGGITKVNAQEAVGNMENLPGDLPDSQEFRGNMGGFGGGSGGMGDFGMDSKNSQKEAWVWIGISAAVLALGLCFVKGYPRSKF